MMNSLAIGLGVFAAAFILGLVILGVLSFIFWLWMLIDCLKRGFAKPADKIAWILVLIFLYFLGAVIYYFVERKARQCQIKEKN